MKLIEIAFPTSITYNTYSSNAVKHIRQLIASKLYIPGGNLYDNVYSAGVGPKSMFVVTEGKVGKQFIGVCILDLIREAPPMFDGNIFVLPEYRGHGVARELMKRTYDEAYTRFGKATVHGNSTFVRLAKSINSPIKTKS